MKNTTPTVFNFHNSEVRIIDRDGSPWFVASDVCAALGYKNVSQTIGDHLDDDERSTAMIPTPIVPIGVPTNIISESGLYALVLRSRKPEARKFAKWVTAEVLPAIRKTGGYAQQHPSLINRRWLVSYDHHGKEQVTPVPEDACITSVDRLLQAINEPNGIHVDPAKLFSFVRATLERLERSYEYQANKAAGKPVKLHW